MPANLIPSMPHPNVGGKVVRVIVVWQREK
jgi:hypothetical protein